MAHPLSISNSDSLPRPRGFPWAFVGAIAILIVVELLIRRIPPTRKIPYLSGLEEHFAVANYLEATGPADVGFIGSSMTRAGVSAPIVRSLIEAKTGRRPYIANYGASSTTADESAAIIRYMLRKRSVPRVLMYEVSPAHFRISTSYRFGKLAIFWNFADWLQADDMDYSNWLKTLPIVVRGEIGAYYETFCYREQLSQWVKIRLQLFKPYPAPMAGAMARNWHTRAVLANAGPARQDMLFKRWTNVWIRDGQSMLDPGLVADFERSLKTCRENDITLILYEMPFTQRAHDAFPPQTYPDFYRIVDSLSQKYSVRFIRLAELGVQFDDECFADFAHMNRTGATRLTTALAEKAILPLTELPALAGAGKPIKKRPE